MGAPVMSRAEAYARAMQKQLARIKLSRQDINRYIEYTTKVPPKMLDSGEGVRFAKQDKFHVELQAIWSKHRRAITLAPVAVGKSVQLRKRLEWEIGLNPDILISYISASEKLPKKQLSSMQAEMTGNPRVRHVFPHLRKATIRDDGREEWNSHSLLVPREMSSQGDPTMQIFGLFGNILGSRSNILCLDDIVNYKNTLSQDLKDKIFNWLAEGISRLTPGSKVWGIGHIWAEDDALQRLSKMGKQWFYTRRECYVLDEEKIRENAVEESGGTIDAADVKVDLDTYQMDEKEIIARSEKGELFPLVPSIQTVHDIIEKCGELGTPFDLMMLWNRLPSDIASRFKLEWFQRCLELGRGLITPENPTGFASSWRVGQGAAFTGVDLGHKKKPGSDLTVMITGGRLPNNLTQILDIRSGHWKGDEITEHLEDVQSRFGSTMCVENNGGQTLLIDMVDSLTCIPIIEHETTGANKHDVANGVEQMAAQVRKAKWVFPCDENLMPSDEMAKLIRACRVYNPAAHTPDHLMAWWILKEGMRLSPAIQGMERNTLDHMAR